MTMKKELEEVVAGVRIGAREAVLSPSRTIDVLEPANGQVLRRIAVGGQSEARVAVDACLDALPAWSATPVEDRAEALRQVASDLEGEASDELAVMITRETGKLLGESAAEVAFSAKYFRTYADIISSWSGQTWSHRRAASGRYTVRRYPRGVVAAITPWNFPVSIPARKVAAAFAAGCCVLLKPSEIAPLSSLLFARLCERRLPPGTLSTVVGTEGEVAEVWLGDPAVRAISFTGSTRVGRIVAAAGGAKLKPLVLELGGCAPFIVLEDSNIEDAARCLAGAKYRNNGQSCIAANTAWVHRNIFDAFADRFAELSRSLRLGDPLEPETTLGPMALPGDPARLRVVVESAMEAGADAVELGAAPSRGSFFPPVLCLEPRLDRSLVDNEIFGPITMMKSYTDVAEVVEYVNTSTLGLAGYVCGTNIEKAQEVAAKLEVGIVGVNTSTPNIPLVPFGGHKDSGIGYEGGSVGIQEFTRLQSIAISEASDRRLSPERRR